MVKSIVLWKPRATNSKRGCFIKNRELFSSAETLSVALQKIVSETTGIEDVFVYGNSSEIKIKIAPIEVFVEMSANKIEDVNELMTRLKSKLSEWKEETGFHHPVNLSLIPMNWKVEVGI